jgi:molybdopterin-synthase adenylyltransferase
MHRDYLTMITDNLLPMIDIQRYIRNEQMLSREENLRLRDFRVVVAGCGGLGGYIIEMLARLGIGHITAIDGDVFETSNLNRQLLSHPGNLGLSKADQARERVKKINPDVHITAKHETITKNNALSLLRGHDVIADALDNINSRRIIGQAARKLGIPLVHGAIAGWYAQISTIYPGDPTLDSIYPEGFEKGAETESGNPSFTPALAASLQVSEILKVLLQKDGVLRNKLLVIDTLHHDYQIVEL